MQYFRHCQKNEEIKPSTGMRVFVGRGIFTSNTYIFFKTYWLDLEFYRKKWLKIIHTAKLDR
jgi:hypothetical protein